MTIIVNFLKLTRRFEWFFIIPRNFIICPLLPLYEPQTFLKSCDNPFLQLTAAHCVVGGHTPVAVRLGVSRLVGQTQIFSDDNKLIESFVLDLLDYKYQTEVFSSVSCLKGLDIFNTRNQLFTQ